MSTYKAIRKIPSASQADPKVLAALREIPLSALSDNMHQSVQGGTGVNHIMFGFFNTSNPLLFVSLSLSEQIGVSGGQRPCGHAV